GALPDRASVAHAPRPGGVRVMAFPSLESALNKVSNRYLLVVLSAKRARQLNRGAPPRVDSKHKKPTSSALEEIAAAKVEYRIKDAVEHVALAERAAAIVVAPATANLIAKAAHGVADDFLTTLLLAARCPVLIAPAMDGGMWEHPAVAANVATLRARGVTVMEPDRGALASGLSGRGRLPEPESIVAALASVLAPAQDLTGET